MAERNPRLFSIPPSAPFLPTLIAALTEGRLVAGFPASPDPLALAEATLYLPTRRACRLAQDTFRKVLGKEAAILPRIVPIGDIDEDEIVFADIAAGALAQEALALPRAIDGFERKALLTRLIAAFAKSRGLRGDDGLSLIANTPAAAYALAGELARLQDDMITRGVDWEALGKLVPGEMDRYFETTLEFLKIAQKEWPAVLAERGAIDVAARRDRLIDAEAARLQRAGTGPVIAAGSTGSMPSTAKLLATIANLPNGAVVLPGLDFDLDAQSWNAIVGSEHGPAFGHPQFSMQALLQRLEVTREAVTELGARAPHGREALLSEALRPASETDRWQDRLKQPAFERQKKTALAGVTMIEAANPEEESLAIALALREAVSDGRPESATRIAALITPDRALARRVLAALARWNVPVDDSGGDALADTRAGIFARLAAEMALQGCEPVPLLALLRYPLCRLGGHEFSHLPAAALLERAILRGPRPRPGADGLLHALETLRKTRDKLHRSDPRRAMTDENLDLAVALAQKLKVALEPLAGVKTSLPLLDLAEKHHAVISALSRDHNNDPTAFADRDGKALGELFQAIVDSGDAATFAVAPRDYPELFRAIASERMVRRPGAPNARVRIYGPLEARLQDADRVVLGGLVESVWPPEPQSDPWLNRPMRQELGLDLPERRIGLSAHDFAQSLGAKEAILSYPAKREGTPVVVSRFVQRLTAVAGDDDWKTVRARGQRYLDFARALDAAGKPVPAARPAPTPPLDARPKRLSVTEIEDWLRDPYSIYAKRILKLQALDPVDTPPGARDRGTVIHKAIGDFTVKFAKGLPAEPYGELIALGREAFAPLLDYPEAEAFWWPRFERIARWFVEWEVARRKLVQAVFAETGGELQVSNDFLLTARADRIDLMKDGSLAVLDYKTGQPPTAKQVKAGLSPQLTLQAAMLRDGTFKDLKLPGKASVSELLYLRLSGGDPGGEEQPRDFKDSTVDEEADEALARLRNVVARFASAEQPYLSFSRPMFFGRSYGDYDHLARVKEWSATGGEGDGE
jgi:ATP-dependent helicase/nuclease subunit B